jgi:serine/threonine-protein kinase
MAADPPVTAVGRGALAIASDPPGASIVVNGESTGQTTPSTLAKLALGTPYTITLKKDGFQDAAQTVTLTAQEPSSAVSLALQRGTLSVDVSVRPLVPGVTLSLDRKAVASTAIDGVTAGEEHQLVVWAPGYAVQTVAFTGATGEKKHFDVALVKAEGARPSERAAAAAPAVVNAGSGKLNVSAHGGWCNVSIDGAAKGPTPIAGVVLPAGTHTVTCTPEGGKTMSAAVKVEADGTARYAFTIPQ